MLYGAPFPALWEVATDETITMSPRGRVRMEGRTSRQRWWGPMAWVPRTRTTSVGSVSATALPRLAMPPLLTRRSMGPRSATTASTIRASCSASSMLAW